MLIRIDLSQLSIPIPAEENEGDEAANELRAQLEILQQRLHHFKSIVGEQPIYGLVELPSSFAQPPVYLFFNGISTENEKALSERFAPFDFVRSPTDDWLIACLPVRWMDRYAGYHPKPTYANIISTPKNLPVNAERFATGLKTVEQFPVQIVLAPPAYLWAAYEDLLTELPEQFGGGSVSTLTQGLRWMAIGINPATMEMNAIVQSASADAAQKLAGQLPALLNGVLGFLPQPSHDRLRKFTFLVGKQLTSQVAADQIQISIRSLPDPQQNAAEFLELMKPLLESISEREIKPKLRQLALAIHNYESAVNCFPPGPQHRGADGKSGLSWRVHILPFLDEMELYRQFKLDEPWDSAHNKPLLAKMPNIYRTDSILSKTQSPTGFTTIVAPAGEGTIFGGREAVTFSQITDGSSNTIMLVELIQGVVMPWTAPEDYFFDESNPAALLKVNENGRFFAAMADGSVHEIPADLPPKSIKALFQMNDGDAVRWK